jgi:peptidoglycan/xylan/chitin deacetylase (PgdA/CDA1 family)
MASILKHVVEGVLAHGGPAALANRRNRPHAAILAYHNIVPRGERAAGELSLHIDQDTFGRQLDLIAAHATIVPLATIMRPRQPGENDRPRVAITFDDAYVGTMTAGVEELQKRGLAGTVFVPPGMLGKDGFWWDLLSRDGQPLPVPLRDHALTVLQGDTNRILSWASSRGLPVATLPEHARPDAEAHILDAGLPPRITLGAHSWSHPNLAVVSSDRLDDELDRTRAWLTQRSDRFVDWLAYPYGLRNDAVIEAASKRYAGALRVTGGLATRCGRTGAAPHDTPRINIPRGLSLDGLKLRIAGLIFNG